MQRRFLRDARLDRNRSSHPAGFGRLDAAHIPINELACDLLERPHNCAPAVAPTTPHQLWLTPFYDFVLSNGSSHNPVFRNAGQALGSYIRLSRTLGSWLRVENLFLIQEWLKELEPPRWREPILGAIDRAGAARGETLYRGRCEGCHALPPYPLTEPNPFGNRFIPVTYVAKEEIGIDPVVIDSLAARSRRRRRGAYPSPGAKMTELERVLRGLDADLGRCGASWALVGGLAVGTRAEPRTTRDVDAAIDVADDREAEQLVAALASAGYAIGTVLEHDTLARLATVTTDRAIGACQARSRRGARPGAGRR
jgi:hypothetical protein